MSEGESLVPNEDFLRWERIDPEDPQYKEIVEKNRTNTTRFLFGLHELNVVKSCDESAQGEPDEGVFYDSVKKSFLESSLLNLKKIATEHQLASVGFENLIYEVSDADPEIKKRLEEIFPDSFFDADGIDMVNAFPMIENINNIPLDLYQRILEVHVAAYYEKDKVLQEKIPAMKSRFEDRIKKYIDPDVADLGKIKKKLSSVKIVSGDYLLYSDFTKGDGDYNPDDDTAVIPTGEIALIASGKRIDTGDYQEYVYTHEMFHAVSGLAVLGGKEESETIKDLRLQRSGLLTQGRFRWLNEALTERLAIKILGLGDSNAYGEERDLLQIMIDRGVPEELFTKAYFEDQKPGKGAPSLKRLIKAINEKCGPKFLQETDEAIDIYGIEDVIEEVKDDFK